ncbi:hypothetical protein AB4865_00350 [Capnocytophaga sp. ARDL2]
MSKIILFFTLLFSSVCGFAQEEVLDEIVIDMAATRRELIDILHNS